MGPAVRFWHDANGAPPGAASALARDSTADGAPLTACTAGRSFGNALGDSNRTAILVSLAVISAAYFYAAISRSIADHFWMDEVLAVSAASQSSLAGVWRAIWAGTDFSPPAYHAFLHGLMKVFGAGDDRLLWRAPSILAVYGAAICTYALLVKSQVSRLSAVLAGGIVLAFGLFDFAIQVRQYAPLAFGLAAALLLWAGIDDGRTGKMRAAGLWLTLAVCLCLHFYAAIEVAVIGVAEAIYAVSRKRVRLAVWLALLATLPVEAALYPLAAHLAAFNNGDNLAPDYYARPTIGGFIAALYEIVDGGRPGMLLLVLAAFLIAVLNLHGCVRARSAAAATAFELRRTGNLSELEIVMIALCALPFMTFAFSLLVTKSFSSRYMAAAALLPALAAGYMLNWLRWRRGMALALVPLVAGILAVRAQAPDFVGEALTAVRKAPPSDPIVVGEGQLYIELMQAAGPDLQGRLFYLTRPAGVASPDPTNENEVVRLATFHPEYQVSAPAAFLKTHARFCVLARPNLSADTTTPLLIDQGLLGKPVDAGDGILLFPSAEAQQGGGKP